MSKATSKRRTSTMRGAFALLFMSAATLLSVASAPVEPNPEGWEERTDFPVDVGFGWQPWVSYHEYGELPMERGFQGGQHINASIRTYGLEPQPGAYICSIDLVGPSGEADGFDDINGDCEVGTPAELEISAPADLAEDSVIAPWLRLVVPGDLDGQERELRVQIETPDGQIGRAWVKAPVTWMPTCEDVGEDYELPCNPF